MTGTHMPTRPSPPPSHTHVPPLPQDADEEAARVIAHCGGDPQQRHTASQLLEDPFLQVC